MARTLTEEQRERARANQRAYYVRHIERLRAKGKETAARNRRRAGMPELGSPESIENRRNARKAKGLEHGNWKGDEVGYVALHVWVDRHKKRTGTCSECGVTPDSESGSSFRKAKTEWANVSGEYRRDLDDFVELCAPCHRRQHAKGLIHGTVTGYGYYKCRCDDCRSASTLAARARREAR